MCWLYGFQLFQSVTHELIQNVSCTGHCNPGTWSVMAAWLFLPTFDIQKRVELTDVSGHCLCLGSLVLFVEQELQPEPEFL